MRETDTPAPMTPYCIAKLAGEQLLSFYAQRSKLSWLALRFFNVYGPGQPTDAYYTSVVLTFLRRLATGEAPVIDGRGEQSMDFVLSGHRPVRSALAVDSEATGEVLNVGTGKQTTVAELAGPPDQGDRRGRHARVPPARGAGRPSARPQSSGSARCWAGSRPSSCTEGLASVVDHLKNTGEMD